MSVDEQSSRTAIVEAARDLFYQKGFTGTSYADIAKRTGFAKGNIHYYFNSKDELLKAVVERRVQDIRDLLERWSLGCGPAYDCLRRFVGMIESNAEDLSRYGCPMGSLNSELGKNNPDLQKAARLMFDLFARWLEARFRALMPPKQAKEHAEQLMVMAQGVSVTAHTYGDPMLVLRQARVMRRWLKRVCADAAANGGSE